MKRIKKHNYLIVLLICVLCNGCGKTGKTVDVDNVDVIEFSELNSDVNIVPIKCGTPMDDILRGVCYDDYIFLLGMSRTSVYCVKEDTVISILNSSGRGYGEYTAINDYSYSQDEHILYVYSDGKILKYSVPEMKFLESVETPVYPSGMIVLNSKEILMNCSYMEDNGEDAYRGICIVSSQTGQVIKRCYDFDYINKKMMMQCDLTAVPGGFVFPLNSLELNSLVSYNMEDESTEELFTYRFNSDWRVPRRMVKLAKKDYMLYAMEDFKETRHLEGGHYLSISDKGLSFWCFPRIDDNVRSVAVLVNDDGVSCRSYIIAGTGIYPSPFFYHDGFCVDIVSSTELDGVDIEGLSPLGLELKRVVDAQKLENPVFLFFKAD